MIIKTQEKDEISYWQICGDTMRQIVLVILFPVLIMGQYRDIPEVVTKVATAAGGF